MNPPSSPNKTPERMSAQVAGWRSDGRWWALIAQLGRSAYKLFYVATMGLGSIRM